MNKVYASYDLVIPGQNYDAVIKRIKSLGGFRHVQQSCFEIETSYPTSVVYTCLLAAMDPNDKLLVINPVTSEVYDNTQVGLFGHAYQRTNALNWPS